MLVWMTSDLKEGGAQLNSVREQVVQWHSAKPVLLQEANAPLTVAWTRNTTDKHIASFTSSFLSKKMLLQ